MGKYRYIMENTLSHFKNEQWGYQDPGGSNIDILYVYHTLTTEVLVQG